MLLFFGNLRNLVNIYFHIIYYIITLFISFIGWKHLCEWCVVWAAFLNTHFAKQLMHLHKVKGYQAVRPWCAQTYGVSRKKLLFNYSNFLKRNAKLLVVCHRLGFGLMAKTHVKNYGRHSVIQQKAKVISFDFLLVEERLMFPRRRGEDTIRRCYSILYLLCGCLKCCCTVLL